MIRVLWLGAENLRDLEETVITETGGRGAGLSWG